MRVCQFHHSTDGDYVDRSEDEGDRWHLGEINNKFKKTLTFLKKGRPHACIFNNFTLSPNTDSH